VALHSGCSSARWSASRTGRAPARNPDRKRGWRPAQGRRNVRLS
jgi:hypothetical protein